MSHGFPDYGIGAPDKTIYSTLDVGELAARLGSIVTFDRAGNVIFMEDFESGLNKWWMALSGGGGDAIVLTNEKARSGAISCKVTTGAVAGNREQLSHYTAVPVPSKVGIEVSFTLGPPEIESIEMQILSDDGTNLKWARFRLIRAGVGSSVQTLQYRSSGGVYVTFGTVKLYPSVNYFVPAKLVIDLVNNTYVRFVIANYSFDLSASPIAVGPSFLTPGTTSFDIFVENRAAGNHSLYLDDVIITQNEL